MCTETNSRYAKHRYTSTLFVPVQLRTGTEARIYFGCTGTSLYRYIFLYGTNSCTGTIIDFFVPCTDGWLYRLLFLLRVQLCTGTKKMNTAEYRNLSRDTSLQFATLTFTNYTVYIVNIFEKISCFVDKGDKCPNYSNTN